MLSDYPPATHFNRPVPIAFCPSSTNANQRQYLFLTDQILTLALPVSGCLAVFVHRQHDAHDQKHSGTKLKHDSASFENVDDFSI